MNKIKMLLLALAAVLLFAACNKPDETPTDPTNATQQATEATEPETNLPGVEENQFSEDEIVIPTDPIAETTGGDSESGNNEGGVTNTGSGNAGGQDNSGSQGGSGNQGSSGGQGDSGNQGGSGNQGNSGGADDPAKPTEPDATAPSGELVYVSYEEYNNMSPEEQMAYFNQFPSMEAFVQWHNEAKEEYDKEHGAIEIGGDGSVDLGEIVKP